MLLLPKTTKTVFAFCTNKNLKTQEVSCLCVLLCTNTMGSSLLNNNVDENPGPFTQINNDKNVPCTKQVSSVSLLESRLSESGRISVNALGDGNCFFCAVSQSNASYITTLSIICVNTLLEFSMFCTREGGFWVLHHPELYIESDYENSVQNYVNNMERQGRWADNIIIQMQISPLSQV